MARWERLTALAAGLVLVAVATAACGANTKTPGAPTSSTTPSASSTTTAQDTETVPATVAPPLPNPVRSVAKVSRPGAPSTPSVSAPVSKFSAPVTYPDGVRLTIVKAQSGIETGHGPGVMAGRAYVRFELTLRNGSSKPINLNQVVVTTYYGTSKQLAAPVYTESAKTYDFSGTVQPGKSTTAYYAFAVPTQDRSRVTMVVDFDGLHTSATYSGAVVAS